MSMLLWLPNLEGGERKSQKMRFVSNDTSGRPKSRIKDKNLKAMKMHSFFLSR